MHNQLDELYRHHYVNGLGSENAILLLDAARKQEKEGVDREEALMHAGRVRLRPILMTTFALIAGMIPVAFGLGEGGEFYRPARDSDYRWHDYFYHLDSVGGTGFYDSIEIARDRMMAKMRRRAERMSQIFAFGLTMLEALLTLLGIRLLFRLSLKLFNLIRGRRPSTALRKVFN